MVEREVRASAQTAWAAWTQPEHLRQWYGPHPTVIADCEIDLRPGGVFRFVTRTAGSVDNPVVCCYLVVEPFSRLVWTNALLPGFRPAPSGFFTAVMTLEPRGDNTLCTTVAMHRNQDDCGQHAAMGFHDGWGTVLQQLAAYAPTI
jgi:uncharacterized protein YndB with AHSA1/START domain